MPKRELPETDDLDGLDEYWFEDTTITVRRLTKARLDAHREGRPWDVFLEQLRQEHADPITLSDAEAIAEHVSERVEGNVDKDELALATAEYLMTEYELPEKVAQELEGRY